VELSAQTERPLRQRARPGDNLLVRCDLIRDILVAQKATHTGT